MKNFKLVEDTMELKNLKDYKKGMVFDEKAQYPREIKSFETEEEALEELKKYKSTYDKNSWKLTEYYVEFNDGENYNLYEFSDLVDETMLELLRDIAIKNFDEENEDLEKHIEELADEVLEKFEDYKELKDDLKEEIREYAKDNGWID